MKRLIYIVSLLFLSLPVIGQFNTATTSTSGTWLEPNTWNADPGISKPPDGSWTNGEYIIIQHAIDIANNKVVDLSTSSVRAIRVTNNGSLSFGANSQLILPENAVIILEEDAILSASNESKKTLIQIGENAVWGNQACDDCIPTLEGYGIIDKNFDPTKPLPIGLLSFTGIPQTSSVQLDWVTAWEENFDFFTIERAGKDLQFKAIGTVKGNGNSVAEVAYSFTDTQPLQGQTFYRLKATDFDGSFEHHKIISVHFNGLAARVNTTTVYPNPVTHHSLKVETSEALVSELRLVDLSGRIMYTQKVEMGTNEIHLPASIKAGSYILVLLHHQGKQHQEKIMVL